MPTNIIPGPIETELKVLSDEEVLRQSVAQPDCFGELVTRYESPFLRKALSILGNEDDARDAVQEAFVRIYTAAARFEKKKGAQFSSWGYSILVNRCYTLYAKNRKRMQVSLDKEPEMADVIPDENSTAEHERMLIREYVLCMLSRLPLILRRVANLHFIQGKPSKEIARLSKISDGAVRTQLHRAKKMLKKIHFDLSSVEEKRKDKSAHAALFVYSE